MRDRAWRRYIEEKIVIKRLNSLVVKSKYYWYFKDCNMITFKNCKSLTLSDTIGTEYAFKDAFMVRAGYFHESRDKGARNYFSMGAGFKYTSTKIDVSYLFSTSKIKNPLENTLRFSLTFNFGDNYGLN